VHTGLTTLLTVGVALATPAAQSAPPREIVGHVLKPTQAPPPAVGTLKVAEGFRVRRFAENLGKPRMLALSPDGGLYVTRRDVGDVLLVRDQNGDGAAEAPVVVARRPQMHGIAVAGNQVFLATVKEVFTAERQPDGRLGELKRIIDDLPDGGQHPNRTLALGPDGMLYISVGSTCNACDETGPEHATLLRAKPSGEARTIFASGLRNTIGFGWHPSTGALWGMDHGIDWLGDEDQGEELNEIQQGQQYGWPYIYADSKVNPQDEPPGRIPSEQWARMSRPPVRLYTPHAAPMQMAFARGNLPAAYREGAFVAMHGSWNRRPPSGYEVVFIRFEQGRPVAIEPFLSGFLTRGGAGGWTISGRPAGLVAAPSGELFVSDDLNGVIYAITPPAVNGATP
jgi:glucose/arabinose dehydrogenase